MALESPFGKKTRLRILQEYFSAAGPVTAANAWEHVYHLLLWIDERTRLAHIYDSNHMQPGGNFYSRAVRFTSELCARWHIPQEQLGEHVDFLFKGCVRELEKQEGVQTAVSQPLLAELVAQEDAEEAGAELDESELVDEIAALLARTGLAAAQVSSLAREIAQRAKTFYTIGNKRKNALGEGFEDVVEHLLQSVARIPAARLRVRTKISELPGFKRAAPVAARGGKSERLPKPDIAIVDDKVTYAIITAKWSMRQDRETQFAREYDAYIKNKVQTTELRFFLLTNEFDVARLDNVARAQPDTGGYLFHTVYHMNPELLEETQADRIAAVGGWIRAGKIASLEDFLHMMATTYGA